MNGASVLPGLACAVALLALSVTAAAGAPLELAPFKDKLFAYPGILETGNGGDFVKVRYDKAVDIHQRDTVPERKVRREYVSEKPRRSRSARSLVLGGQRMKYFAVGNRKESARFIVVYLHGSGGNRFQGVNDWTFGGNFNRIQNLAVRNGGLYLSPEFEDFGDKGAKQVAELILHHTTRAPRAPVIIACGSMGGYLCWRLSRNPAVLPKLAGMLLLGSTWDEELFGSAAMKQRLPIYFGHGSWDAVLPWKKQYDFFRRIKKKSRGYPAKFALFDTGTHGTPIRMTDWRLILNWMFSLWR